MVPTYSLDETFSYELSSLIFKHLPNLNSAISPPLKGDSLAEMKKGINNLVNLAVQSLIKTGEVKVESKITINDRLAKRTIKDYFAAVFRTAKELWSELRHKGCALSELKDKIASSFTKNIATVVLERGGKTEIFYFR